MGDTRHVNRTTGLTINSILDIFSMARTEGIEVTIFWSEPEKAYCIKFRKDNWNTMQYISSEQLNAAPNDVKFMYYVFRRMLDSIKEVLKNESD